MHGKLSSFSYLRNPERQVETEESGGQPEEPIEEKKAKQQLKGTILGLSSLPIGLTLNIAWGSQTGWEVLLVYFIVR